ncbi:PREDICTED: uncharacterized protein LOC107346307 [Acropora digitifera]|uniref:uncharacterized protein LOC107346307 n=1 Tax=Acropora digitifera TaxID=70779 RepID=UPI00077AAD46|nr:PREDICTED: uncharacterized protein LOC107346307 [Acropora digitifera]
MITLTTLCIMALTSQLMFDQQHHRTPNTLMVFPAQVKDGVTAAVTPLTSSGIALVDGIMATGFHTNDIVLILRVQATDKELVSYGFMVIPIIGVSTSLFSADGSVATCSWLVIIPMYGFMP